MVPLFRGSPEFKEPSSMLAVLAVAYVAKTEPPTLKGEVLARLESPEVCRNTKEH